MPNTSASGGYLTPEGSPAAPLYDDALDDLLQALFVGLTGLAGTYVRPRFQLKPPKQPAASVDWCAVGAMRIVRDASPAIEHDPTADAGLGHDTLTRHEDIHILASFYGPHASALATMAQDGITLAQNNEVLQSQLMMYVNTDTIMQVPELVNEQWIRRFDLPMHFRRQVKRAYAVENIVSADSTLVRG